LITGHLTRLGTRQDVLAQREYMQDIQAAAQHALEITEVKRDLARKTVGRENLCVFFKTMYDAAAAEAAQPVVKKWTGRLGGVETFAANHTFIMYQSLRLDDNAEPHVASGARTFRLATWRINEGTITTRLTVSTGAFSLSWPPGAVAALWAVPGQSSQLVPTTEGCRSTADRHPSAISGPIHGSERRSTAPPGSGNPRSPPPGRLRSSPDLSAVHQTRRAPTVTSRSR
jgi:hypothetical protein